MRLRQMAAYKIYVCRHFEPSPFVTFPTTEITIPTRYQVPSTEARVLNSNGNASHSSILSRASRITPLMVYAVGTESRFILVISKLEREVQV